ncbi:MAG: hypothetical protein AAF597_06805, partial [Bacteroidota bacterium]
MRSLGIFTIITLFLLFSREVFAQYDSVKTADLKLTRQFDDMMAADYDLRFDSLAPKFKTELKEALITLPKARLDSLATRIKVTESENGELAFYSWDERTGGSWHTMATYGQFFSEDQQLRVQRIGGNEWDTGALTNVRINQIYQLDRAGQTVYLTLGVGTHGGGHYHAAAQVFAIEGDSLQLCTNCFQTEEYLAVQAPRTRKIDLTYHPASMSLTHKEFVFDGNLG